MSRVILHVLDHSAPLHSGYAFRTASILRLQRSMGWTPVPVTGVRQGGGGELEEEVDGILYHRTRPAAGLVARLPGLAELGAIDLLARRVREVAVRSRADLLHAHSPVLNALAALRVGRALGLPVLYEVRAIWEDAAVDHGTQGQRSLRYRVSRALETRAVRRVDALAVICEGLRREFRDRGVPDSKLTVIPNAVDTGRFRPGGARDGALARSLGIEEARVLGFIGSFYGYEGLPVLLRALPAILEGEPRVVLLLVGGGPEDQSLRDLSRSLGIDRHVRFTGRIPHAEVGRYYDLVDLFVYPRLPTRTTELVTPLKPLEAMAQGRLVVASDVGGHRELIRDGETGTLFRAGDPGALTEACLSLLRDESRWPALRTAARAFVERERTWAASIARYDGVYATLLRARDER